MLRGSFHGAEHVELLSLRGKDALKAWKGSERVAQEFDSTLKGYCLLLGSGPAVAIELPASSRASLGLVQPFLVLQLKLDLGAAFSLELVVTDTAGGRRRVLVSSSFSAPHINPLHIKLPLDAVDVPEAASGTALLARVPRGSWVSLCLDLPGIVAAHCRCVAFAALEAVAVHGCCRLKGVFALKHAPAAAGLSAKYPASAPMPRAVDFNAGVPCSTVMYSGAVDAPAPASSSGGGGAAGEATPRRAGPHKAGAPTPTRRAGTAPSPSHAPAPVSARGVPATAPMTAIAAGGVGVDGALHVGGALSRLPRPTLRAASAGSGPRAPAAASAAVVAPVVAPADESDHVWTARPHARAPAHFLSDSESPRGHGGVETGSPAHVSHASPSRVSVGVGPDRGAASNSAGAGGISVAVRAASAGWRAQPPELPARSPGAGAGIGRDDAGRGASSTRHGGGGAGAGGAGVDTEQWARSTTSLQARALASLTRSLSRPNTAGPGDGGSGGDDKTSSSRHADRDSFEGRDGGLDFVETHTSRRRGADVQSLLHSPSTSASTLRSPVTGLASSRGHRANTIGRSHGTGSPGAAGDLERSQRSDGFMRSAGSRPRTSSAARGTPVEGAGEARPVSPSSSSSSSQLLELVGVLNEHPSYGGGDGDDTAGEGEREGEGRREGDEDAAPGEREGEKGWERKRDWERGGDCDGEVASPSDSGEWEVGVDDGSPHRSARTGSVNHGEDDHWPVDDMGHSAVRALLGAEDGTGSEGSGGDGQGQSRCSRSGGSVAVGESKEEDDHSVTRSFGSGLDHLLEDSQPSVVLDDPRCTTGSAASAHRKSTGTGTAVMGRSPKHGSSSTSRRARALSTGSDSSSDSSGSDAGDFALLLSSGGGVYSPTHTRTSVPPTKSSPPAHVRTPEFEPAASMRPPSTTSSAMGRSALPAPALRTSAPVDVAPTAADAAASVAVQYPATTPERTRLAGTRSMGTRFVDAVPPLRTVPSADSLPNSQAFRTAKSDAGAIESSPFPPSATATNRALGMSLGLSLMPTPRVPARAGEGVSVPATPAPAPACTPAAAPAHPSAGASEDHRHDRALVVQGTSTPSPTAPLLGDPRTQEDAVRTSVQGFILSNPLSSSPIEHTVSRHNMLAGPGTSTGTASAGSLLSSAASRAGVPSSPALPAGGFTLPVPGTSPSGEYPQDIVQLLQRQRVLQERLAKLDDLDLQEHEYDDASLNLGDSMSEVFSPAGPSSRPHTAGSINTSAFAHSGALGHEDSGVMYGTRTFGGASGGTSELQRLLGLSPQSQSHLSTAPHSDALVSTAPVAGPGIGTEKAGSTGFVGRSRAEEAADIRLKLIYDPVLKCYFDPAANKYYELRESSSK